MPKKPDTVDARVLADIEQVFGEVLTLLPQHLRGGAIPAIETDQRMRHHYAETEPAVKNPKLLKNRWGTLRAIADGQTRSILSAASVVVALEDVSDQDMVEALTHSVELGRQFGRVGAWGMKAYDEALIKDMYRQPIDWFDYDAEGVSVDFSEIGKTELRKHYKQGVGCSALMVGAVVDGQHYSLFDAYWQHFSEQFVAREEYADPISRALAPAPGA